VLGLRETEIPRLDNKMEFRIFVSPLEMMEEVRARNRESKNSARITAGFCWPWSNPMPDGTLIKDVQVGNLQMPWEKKTDFWKWATHDSGMEQIGTVYTAQGFEFDYIAVIFGKDLVYAPKMNSWKVVPSESFDTQVARNNPDLADHLKSVYRVLLSRAHKGVYIYFVDPSTRKYFEANMGVSTEAGRLDETKTFQEKPRLMPVSVL